MYRDENKRPEVITVKMDKETKKNLEHFAKQRKWSLSQSAYEIIKNYFLSENKG